jgi:hypothetical protein
MIVSISCKRPSEPMPVCRCQVSSGALSPTTPMTSDRWGERERRRDSTRARQVSPEPQEDGAFAFEVEAEHEPQTQVERFPAGDQQTHGDQPSHDDVEGYPSVGQPVERKSGRQHAQRGGHLTTPVLTRRAQAVELKRSEDTHEHRGHQHEMLRREHAHGTVLVGQDTVSENDGDGKRGEVDQGQAADAHAAPQQVAA